DLAEHDRGPQLGMGADEGRIHPEAFQRPPDVGPEGIVAHLCDDGTAMPVASGGDGDVGGGPSQVAVELLDPVESHADLGGIQVDPDPSHGDQLVAHRGQVVDSRWNSAAASAISFDPVAREAASSSWLSASRSAPPAIICTSCSSGISSFVWSPKTFPRLRMTKWSPTG